jgi:excisionase family DNA binding protein
VPQPVLYTVEEAAEMLGVTVDFIRRRYQKGEIPHVRIGRYVKFSQANIDAIVDQFTVQPSAAPTPRRRRRRMADIDVSPAVSPETLKPLGPRRRAKIVKFPTE